MNFFLQIPPEPKNIVKTKVLGEINGSIAEKMTKIWAIYILSPPPDPQYNEALCLANACKNCPFPNGYFLDFV